MKGVKALKGSISICIPAYRGKHLAETIESALAQTRTVNEIIILDDNSPDDLQTVVKPYIAEPTVRYFRNEKNVGVPENYNMVLGMAQSDYVMILGDHDILLDTFVEQCAKLLDEHPDITLVYWNGFEIDSEGNITRQYKHKFPKIMPGRQLARWMVTHVYSPVCLVTLVRRSALEKLDPWFDPKYWWYTDIYLWIRLAAEGKVGFIHEPIILRRHKENEHYLSDKQWESLAMCRRIRRDSWRIAFPTDGLLSHLAKLNYQFRHDWAGIQLYLSLKANSVTKDYDSEILKDYFSPFGKLVLSVISLPPRPAVLVLQMIKRLVRRLFSESDTRLD